MSILSSTEFVSPVPDSGINLDEKVTRRELFAFVNQLSQLAGPVPYHGLVLSLLMEKSGITEADIEAHREFLLARIKEELEAKQADGTEAPAQSNKEDKG